MNILMSVYVFILFFVLVPGQIVRLPMNASKLVVNLTHALVFAIIFHFTHDRIMMMTSGMETLVMM